MTSLPAEASGGSTAPRGFGDKSGHEPSTVALAVKINGLVPNLASELSAVPELVAELESWGAGQVTIGQHLLYGRDVDHPGSVSIDPTRPSMDPLVVLAAIAARTTRIRLATGAVIAPLYSPAILAKAAATLDVLSGSRLDLGVAAGWHRPEFDALGVPFDQRFRRLDEVIDACRALWGPSPVNFKGEWTEFTDITVAPRPTHPDGIRVLIGGRPSAVTGRRVARRGDGWLASEGATTDEVRRGVQEVVRACQETDRDPADLIFRATLNRDPDDDKPALQQLLPHALELARAGANVLTLPLGKWAATREIAEDLVRGLLEALRTGDEVPRGQA